MNEIYQRQPHQRFNPGLAKGIVRAVKMVAGRNPLRFFQLIGRARIFSQANQRRQWIYENDKILVPPFLILSVTMKCDLNCIGCYSRDYPRVDELSIEEIDDLFNQAKNFGVAFFVITGGEPMIKKGLMELLYKHKRLNFFLFTNGSFHTRNWAQTVARHPHIIPLLSVEGDAAQTNSRRGKGVHEKVIESMRHLKEAGVFFGFSTMVSKKNIDVIGSDDFMDEMIGCGSRICYFVNYVPQNTDHSLVPSPEEQEQFRKRVIYFKENKDIIMIHMPDDEYANGGSCMAAGRGFLHINAQGYVEPCPFAHLATDSVRDKSLKEVFKSDLFDYIRKHPQLLKKPQLGCALYENREKLYDIADQVGAVSTELESKPEV
jgi:MoaA/NifB/PqqE/SkfB family radical SAM enzyme